MPDHDPYTFDDDEDFPWDCDRCYCEENLSEWNDENDEGD